MTELDGPPDLHLLATLVHDCSVSGVPRRVLLLRTDLLPPRLARPHHLRLAEEALEPLTGAERARSYALSHGRLAISWRGEATDRLARAMSGLHHLMQDAPPEAPSVPELARLFTLPGDGAALLALAASPSPAEQVALAAHPPPPPPAPLPPLDADMLDGIENRLGNANVARFARLRPVCRLGAKEFVPAWQSRFLSLRALMAELAPGHDAFADPWLLRRLSRLGDRRLMALLSSGPELRGAGPFSLRLNVSTVLSPEFLRFDNSIPPALRGHALLELRPGDVLADLPAFRFAQAFARARFYRVVLRGVTPTVLDLLDLAALGPDFVSMRWSPALQGLHPDRLAAGPARWILSDVDTEDALHWARGAGIDLVQGRLAVPGPIPAAGQKAARTAA